MPGDSKMTLVRVADLVGKDIEGKRADVRSRLADGSLMHEHTADTPRIVTMKRVILKTQGLGPTLERKFGKASGQWLYWYWQKDTTRMEDCGYSGVLTEDGKHLEYHILMEDV